MTLLGYFLGNVPFVKNHLELMILLIVFLSILPGRHLGRPRTPGATPRQLADTRIVETHASGRVLRVGNEILRTARRLVHGRRLPVRIRPGRRDVAANGRWSPRFGTTLRETLGGAILLGLELLVAADIVKTVTATPSLTDAAVLGLIVLIRTVLSISIEVEIDGVAPWRKALTTGPGAGTGNARIRASLS